MKIKVNNESAIEITNGEQLVRLIFTSDGAHVIVKDDDGSREDIHIMGGATAEPRAGRSLADLMTPRATGGRNPGAAIVVHQAAGGGAGNSYIPGAIVGGGASGGYVPTDLRGAK